MEIDGVIVVRSVDSTSSVVGLQLEDEHPSHVSNYYLKIDSYFES